MFSSLVVGKDNVKTGIFELENFVCKLLVWANLVNKTEESALSISPQYLNYQYQKCAIVALKTLMVP